MKNLKRILFIGKSLLWSVILYATTVMVLDWEDIMKEVKKQPDVVLVNSIPKALPQRNVEHTTITVWVRVVRVIYNTIL